MLMAALSPKAQAVIQDGLQELRPAAGERGRLEALLDARLSAIAPPVYQEPSPVRAGGWRLMTSLGVGVALVGGAAFLMLRPKPSPAPVAMSSSLASQPSAPPIAVQPEAPAPEVTAVVVPEPARAAKAQVEPQAPAARPQDRLAQEVALLSRATSDLRAGRAANALKLLDEHQRKFPNGVLGVERRAVRAQALCTLKRVGEGRAELAHLAPQSPAAGRAKQLCDAAAAADPAR